jgi:hypothetical protein
MRRFCRKLQTKMSEFITLCYLRSHGIELLRWRLWPVLCGRQLPLANGVHDFHSRNRTPGYPKRLEAQHGVNETFYSSVILFHEVGEVFGVADDNSRLARPVVALDRRCVRATLIDGDLLREPLGATGLA